MKCSHISKKDFVGPTINAFYLKWRNGGFSKPICSGKLKNRPRNKPLMQWSLDVRKRDGHKCLDCGATKKLHAHHIKPKAKYPELALDISNGMTLCSICHAKIHGLIGLIGFGGSRFE